MLQFSRKRFFILVFFFCLAIPAYLFYNGRNITDNEGLAIAGSRAATNEEIDRVNTEAGGAVLYYRTSQGFKSHGNQRAVPSSNGLFNAAVANALASAGKDPHAGTWHLKVKAGKRMYEAAAARIPQTGWLPVTIDTNP